MQTPGPQGRTDRPRREIRRPALGKPVGSAACGKRKAEFDFISKPYSVLTVSGFESRPT
jgi:hypothetical protein